MKLLLLAVLVSLQLLASARADDRRHVCLCKKRLCVCGSNRQAGSVRGRSSSEFRHVTADRKHSQTNIRSQLLENHRTMAMDTENLIGMVEVRPAIYDYSIKEHYNKELVEQLWEDIARDLRTTPGECKSKWNSLRNSYSRHLREVKTGYGGIKKKKWYLADAMKFLNDFVGSRRKLTGLTTSASVDSYSEDTLDEHTYYEEFGNGSYMTYDAEQKFVKAEISEPDLNESSTDRLHCPPPVRNEHHPKPILDPNAIFFQSLLPDLSKLDARRQRTFKIQVLSMLNSMMDQQEDQNRYREDRGAFREGSFIKAEREEEIL